MDTKLLILIAVISIVLIIAISIEQAELEQAIDELEQEQVNDKHEIIELNKQKKRRDIAIDKNKQEIQKLQEEVENKTKTIEEKDKEIKRIKEASRVSRGASKPRKQPPPTKGNYLGEFTATGYCPCSICNGKWVGMPTASGTNMVAGRTTAVDPNVIGLGSSFTIEGLGRRVAEDTGSAIKGRKIDIFFNTHQEALNWGRRKVKIYK